MSVFDFSNIQAKCIWIIASDDNVNQIWDAIDAELISSTDPICNASLFDANDLKIVFKKEFAAFFKDPRDFWQNRTFTKADNDALATKDDVIIDCAKIPLTTLIAEFCKIKNYNFAADEMQIMLKIAKNLQDVEFIYLLKLSDILPSDWANFLTGLQMNTTAENWYQKFKQNSLVSDAIIRNTPMPVLQYLLKAEQRSEPKAIVQFLLANIRSGQQIFEQQAIWYALIEQYYAK